MLTKRQKNEFTEAYIKLDEYLNTNCNIKVSYAYYTLRDDNNYADPYVQGYMNIKLTELD